MLNLAAHRNQHLKHEHLCASAIWILQTYVMRYWENETWYRERTLGWNTAWVLSRKQRSRGCGYAASWARIPVTSRFTSMEFSNMFSRRENSTLIKGPAGRHKKISQLCQTLWLEKTNKKTLTCKWDMFLSITVSLLCFFVPLIIFIISANQIKIHFSLFTIQ